MKLKLTIIAKIQDGIIAANKNNIICFDESSIKDDKGEDSLYHTNPDRLCIGQILTDKNTKYTDSYWWYSKKEFEKIIDGWKKIQEKDS